MNKIENYNDLSKVSDWLRLTSERYDRIHFFITPGKAEFRLFIMDQCKRSVNVINKKNPEYLKYLKPGRDRIYFISSGDVDGDREYHNELMAHHPGIVMPNFIKTENLKMTGDMISRWLLERSVGIAFGGGGVRAMAHIGIYEILEKNQLPIDVIAGSSAGAHIGGMVASGMNANVIYDHFLNNVIRQKSHPFNDFTIPRSSFIRGRKYHNLLDKSFNESYCNDTLIPFFPIACDMKTGNEIIVNGTLLKDAILASGSAPGIFPLFEYKDMQLADGGVVNNVPASVLKSYNTDFVISINISIDPSRSRTNFRSLKNIIFQSIDIMVNETLKPYIYYTDFEIKPDIDRFSVTDHKLGLDIINSGRRAARIKLPQLKQSLNKIGINLTES